ncbi:MAG: hypothetical protein COB22_06230 [Cycloclasticus sp.]|nr:MAG: hypothetical protein COB22_06230 [Cycloclasticus sp.]
MYGLVIILAFASCWLNGFGFPIQILLSVGVILSCYLIFNTDVINNTGIEKIQCMSDGYWRLVDNKNQTTVCKLAGTSSVLGVLYFLHFRSKKETINIVLANDSMSIEEQRCLRVTLKVYGKQLKEAKL